MSGVQQALFDVPQAAADGLQAWQPAQWPVAPDWQPVLDAFWSSAAGQQVARFVSARLAQGACIYPAQPLQALALTPLAAVKVVILGQDPYHGPGQAHGLAFSVRPGCAVPPSLRNMFQEIAADPALPDAQRSRPPDGCLERWAQQGVLLLNTCLTVEQGLPASHARQGWEALTDAIVQAVAARSTPTVFLLWGAHAQAKQALVAAAGGVAHCVLTANHPSPLSARRPPQPFVGCGHFAAANRFLVQHGQRPVVW